MSRSGIVSQRKGAGFEQTIINVCVSLRNRGIAWVTKKDTPFGMNNGKVFFRRKSTVDFEGFDLKTGRHIAFECKSCGDGKKFYWTKEHQIRYLIEARLAGCLAFLLVMTPQKLIKFIPERDWLEKRRMVLDLDSGIEIRWDELYDFLIVGEKKD